jgi:hypothetical protein
MSGAATGYARMQGAICKTMMWSMLSALSKKQKKILKKNWRPF